MQLGTELALNAPIELCEENRNRALALLGQAFDLLDEARSFMARTAPSRPGAAHLSDEMVRGLTRRGGAGVRTEFLATATAHLDREGWHHLLDISGLERLMDRQAKNEFAEQLRKAPPPLSADDCRTTMQALYADAGMIFRRGIANTFSSLDRRFRSHDGFKIGARIVLTRAFDDNGIWNRYGDAQATFRDVERTFHLLDGSTQPDSCQGIIGAISDARPRGLQANAYVAETDYFRARIFKNGNLHVWFKRDDLLERVNLLLADYYGAALGSAQADATAPKSRAPARHFSFFPTPAAVRDRMFEEAGLWKAEALTVLEPSAGNGALAFPLAAKGCAVTAVELQYSHVQTLQADGRLADVRHGDFLEEDPNVLGRFDRVIMNPPFCDGRDIDHVRHALRFVAPGGKLVAIMAAGVAYKEDAKTVALRNMVEAAGGRIIDLPARSFAEAGTNINTCLVTIPVRSIN